jgi:hypothetical protein
MRRARKISRRFPLKARSAALIISAPVVALVGGGVYILVSAVSFAIFGGRMLVYPGLLGGMCAGYLLYFLKTNLVVSRTAVVLIIGLSVGLTVFLSRWWLASNLNSVGLIDYLFEYSGRKSKIISVDRTGTGSTDSSAFWFWLFFLVEGGLTIYASAKVARDGFLVP